MLERDPVCGKQVDAQDPPRELQYEGRRIVFCSEHCKQKFLANPEQYAAQAA